MSEPLSQRFWRREQTLRNDHERARRSFFKWVCKEELYGKLEIIHDGPWTHHERGFPKYRLGQFTCGYPTFRSWRSEAYKQWDGEFQKHRDRWLAVHREEREREREQWKRELDAEIAAYEGRCRQRLHSSGAIDVFQLLGAGAAIVHELNADRSNN